MYYYVKKTGALTFEILSRTSAAKGAIYMFVCVCVCVCVYRTRAAIGFRHPSVRRRHARKLSDCKACLGLGFRV
jgi:hypothetical protein